MNGRDKDKVIALINERNALVANGLVANRERIEEIEHTLWSWGIQVFWPRRADDVMNKAAADRSL